MLVKKKKNAKTFQGKEDEAIHYDDKAVDELLDRTKMGIEQKENWSNEYLSSFKVASYVTKEEEEVRYSLILVVLLFLEVSESKSFSY